MRVPLSWLREFVEVELSPEDLAERLTLLGMEVQGLERRGDDWHSVVVGELLEVAPHPHTERLSMTRVRVAEGAGELHIVCGATNIQTGQRVPVALPGAELPGNRQIGVTTIAGVESQGMLCSGDELRLTDDADGILILPAESPVGRPLSELYGETVLDIDVKPNRGDALSIVGLAREVAAATGVALRQPGISVAEEGDATSDHLGVEVREPRLCPRFVGRYLDGLRVGPSPLAVQLRLAAAGQRPVSNVVDATNYVMVELGKPTHAFDGAAVDGGRIVVRLARPGEKLETLDHVTRALHESTLLIADEERALALAGVMGGASSEVSAVTTQVIVESAIFDPVSVRRTAHRYGLRSEASLRFEKGQEWRLARDGADRVAELILSWAGGRAARGVVDSNPSEPSTVRIPFRPARVSRLLGAEIETDEVRSLLERVDVATEPTSGGETIPLVAGGEVATPAPGDEVLVAHVPPHRRDLEIEADLIEEVIRVRGYETVPARRPETPMPEYRPDPRSLADELRMLLSGRGLSEVVTHALVAPADHALLGLPSDDGATIRVANPIAADHSELRRSLLPGLVRTVAGNEAQRRSDLAIFEIGRIHAMRGDGPQEETWLGVCLCGEWLLGGWNQQARQADMGDAKALIEWLAARLGLPPIRYAQGEQRAGVEHPGRTAIVQVSGDAGTLGRLGELDPRYLAAYEVRAQRVAVGLLDLASFEALLPIRRNVRPLSRVPPAERDLAVVVSQQRPAVEVEATIRDAAGELLQTIALFDRYEGAPLDSGEVSLAYRLQLRAPDRTLTEAEIDALVERITGALRERLGARIRR
ncbi:MAG: phenylalanine--tRNA ligase subunit beta [Chloroflexi bacterium]|nr:phenylalanine--tRNA ligase subunit beta [Chloroflexota bacterium]